MINETCRLLSMNKTTREHSILCTVSTVLEIAVIRCRGCIVESRLSVINLRDGKEKRRKECREKGRKGEKGKTIP